MTWDVEFFADFAREFDELEEAVQDELLAPVHLLGEFGPVLGCPWADTLKGSRHANMKELIRKADARFDKHLSATKKGKD